MSAGWFPLEALRRESASLSLWASKSHLHSLARDPPLASLLPRSSIVPPLATDFGLLASLLQRA